MIHTLLQTIVGLASGRTCRRCDQAIMPTDHFGVSEGVCAGCRA